MGVTQASSNGRVSRPNAHGRSTFIVLLAQQASSFGTTASLTTSVQGLDMRFLGGLGHTRRKGGSWTAPTTPSRGYDMAMPRVDTDWTVERLNQLPDDGNRYEAIDGRLFVTPAPNDVHQRAVRELTLLLTPYARALGLDLLFAPRFAPS